MACRAPVQFPRAGQRVRQLWVNPVTPWVTALTPYSILTRFVPGSSPKCQAPARGGRESSRIPVQAEPARDEGNVPLGSGDIRAEPRPATKAVSERAGGTSLRDSAAGKTKQIWALKG